MHPQLARDADPDVALELALQQIGVAGGEFRQIDEAPEHGQVGLEIALPGLHGVLVPSDAALTDRIRDLVVHLLSYGITTTRPPVDSTRSFPITSSTV